MRRSKADSSFLRYRPPIILVACLLTTLGLGSSDPVMGPEAAAGAGSAGPSRSSDPPGGETPRDYHLIPAAAADATVRPGESWLGRNRAQRFRTVFGREGIRVSPESSAAGWELSLRLSGYGPAGAVSPVNQGSLRMIANRAEIDHGRLVEWYVNDARGLEQGFTLRHRPGEEEAATELVIDLELSGNLLAVLDGDGRSVNLYRPGDRLSTLRYGETRVTDAAGQELPVRLELRPGGDEAKRGWRLLVDVTDARYPIEVDPLLTTAAWNSADSVTTCGVAWGDWDGDGDLDLAVGNGGQPNQVYENIGSGLNPTAAWNSAESDDTRSVAWGDWDGDGDLDLAVGNSGQNRVYENSGSGLNPTAAWSSVEGDGTTGIAWGDWDGDGDLDLAVGNSGQNRVYENTGGALNTNAAWSSTESDTTTSVAWGDWNGDGDLDLATGNDGEPNRVYENTGSGLNPTAAWSSSDSVRTFAVAWGDQDGDDDLDLAAGNQGSNRVYENTGGGLNPTATWSSTESETTLSIAWGDWDNDGDLDLAVGNYLLPNRAYDNTGGGLNPTATWSSVESDWTYRVAWGDWDGDGDLDLGAVNIDAPNRVYENTDGALSSLPVGGAGDGSTTTRDAAWGDWDGDGDLDLAVANYFKQNWVYENTGGALNPSPVWESAESESTYSVEWGDWDGDGDLDLAVGNSGAPIANRVYVNQGVNEGLDPNSVWSVLADAEDETYPVAWGDFDGDGDLDLAVGHYQTPTRVYENTGAGLDPNPVWFSAESDRSGRVAWGDFDGDGDLDLAVGNQYGDPNRVYENTGAGLNPTAIWSSAESDTTVSVAWGDWDGDGDLDLAVGNYGEPNRVYRTTAAGLDPSPVWSSVESDHTLRVAWGDWDGDGDLDLAAIGRTAPIRVYENTGAGLNPNAVWSSAFPSTENFAVAWGDWDGDGDLDVVGVGRAADRSIWIHANGVASRPGGLPETPTRPVTLDRPGTTASAYFHSTPEALPSPVMIEYQLQDDQSDPAHEIRAEYSADSGGLWFPATEGPGGDGTQDLAASPAGTPHVFSWDAAADGVDSDTVLFRITVPWQAPSHTGSPIQHGALSATTPPFRVWPDCDGDGFTDRMECAPGDGNLWSAPSPARDLQLGSPAADNLIWTSPAEPGCTIPYFPYYDVLRSTQADDFSSATCVESDEPDRIAIDTTEPSLGGAWFYLIRTQNGCGEHLGVDSEGTPRTGGASCPP